jgi:hypothetical protein
MIVSKPKIRNAKKLQYYKIKKLQKIRKAQKLSKLNERDSDQVKKRALLEERKICNETVFR